MTSDTVFGLLLGLLFLFMAVVLYCFAGLPKLWGPHRWTPICGHPFEQTWAMDPKPEVWTCPKCFTTFVVDPELQKWMPMR